MRLRVLADGTPEVVLPRRAPLAPVKPFVQENAAWIRRQQERIVTAREARAAAAFESSGCAAVDGVPRPVLLTATASRARAALAGEGFRVEAPDLQGARLALVAWYRRRAREVLTDRLDALAPRIGVSFGRVRIGDPKTRWASCSRNGNLNFSWRLLMFPPEVRDYVVIHELCHLKEMNHSRAFWSLVAEFCPDYNVHRKWLKENGPLLVL
jgi:predicted metal-dependent hydrolase